MRNMVFDEDTLLEASTSTELVLVPEIIEIQGPPTREEICHERERNGYCKSVSSEAYNEDHDQLDLVRALFISRPAIPMRPKGIRYGKRETPHTWGWLEDRIYELRDWIADLPFPWGPKQKPFKAEIQWVQGKAGKDRFVRQPFPTEE